MRCISCVWWPTSGCFCTRGSIGETVPCCAVLCCSEQGRQCRAGSSAVVFLTQNSLCAALCCVLGRGLCLTQHHQHAGTGATDCVGVPTAVIRAVLVSPCCSCRALVGVVERTAAGRHIPSRQGHTSSTPAPICCIISQQLTDAHAQCTVTMQDAC